jgi:hypothetical protein
VKKVVILAVIMLVVVGFVGVAVPTQAVLVETAVYVYNLQPSWTEAGGGGVFSAYIGPPDYGYVSPGTTAIFSGRQAGIIKAGLNVDPDGHYWDEGLFGFKPTITINNLASMPLTYDVVNQEGTNPVWMTIEIDTGVVGDRADNTVYQFVPATNPSAWHTVDAGTGQWQKWNDGMGDVTGNPLISLSAVAATHSGLDVVRAYLRLGMGDSYNGTGSGTVAWVDKATIGGVMYDFVVGSAKAITTFNLTTPAITGVINESAKTIILTVPFGTNVTALAPTVSITGISLAPLSGAPQNFTSPVNYTVTAADTSTAIYTVTVTASAPSWDLNGDHVINIGDVVVVGLHWGQTGASGWIPADLNSDGAINIGDVVVLGLHWGQTW